MKRTVTALLAAGLCSQSASAVTTEAASTLQLDTLIAEALHRDPGLRALQLKSEALRHRAGPAGALPEPLISAELSNVPTSDWDFDSTPMSGLQLGVSQWLPWPGKRAAREHVAHVVAAAADEEVREGRAEVVERVKGAYLDLAFLDRAIGVTERTESALRDVVRIAQIKYSVGRGLQQDILKAQVSLASLRDRLVQLRSQRRQAALRLNAALSRDFDTVVGPTPRLQATTLTRDVEQLRQLAVAQRPSLAALRRHVEHWRAAEELARLEGRPDFEVRLAYRQRSYEAEPVRGSDFVSVGVGVTLPVWRERKQNEEAAEARITAQVMEAEYAARRLAVEVRIHELYLQVEEHRARLHLLRTATIPQAQQALTASLAAYQVDRLDFRALLDSQIGLLQFEIEEHRHLTEAEKGLARIEAEVGMRLFPPTQGGPR